MLEQWAVENTATTVMAQVIAVISTKKTIENPIYRRYNPIEITSYN
jgi:hypothetical protein